MEKNSHMLTVGDFVLNTDSRKLFFKDNTEVALPPTLFTLLKYFVDNQNQVLSKDMIISNVWKGKIVVEANINQNIKKLRDILGDSASNPKYIETVTGEGFRFVANSEDYKSVPGDNESKQSKFIYVVGLLVVLFVIGMIFLIIPKKVESNLKQFFPLTTLKGLENFPELSKDKKYLLFNNKNEDSWGIYIKPLNEESYHVLVNSKDNEVFPRLSYDQKKLLYIVHRKNGCSLILSDINLNNFTLSNPIELKSCNRSGGRLKAEWINADEIFISVNEDLKSAASIYRFNLKTKTQELISKPDTKGFGDYVFRYSKQRNKLAYVRNIGWSSSEIWVYDLTTKKHAIAKSTTILIGDIDWTDNGQLLFQSASKEISVVNDDGSNEKVIARASSNVYVPFAIDSSSIGAVVGNFSVIDIGVFDISNQAFQTLISSSFNDYFGAKGNDFFAFVSTRSGDPQIWKRDNKGNDIQLSHFTESFEIKNMSVSSKGNLIAYNKSGQIEVIDDNGNEIFNSRDYSNSVHDNAVFDIENNRILYAIQYNGEWNIESRSLSALGDKRVLFKGVSARSCINEDCIYYFKEKDPYLYKYTPTNNTSIRMAKIGFLFSVDEWDIFEQGSIVYTLSGDKENELEVIDLQTKEIKSLFKVSSKRFNFDRWNYKIYTSITSAGNTDLMYFNL